MILICFLKLDWHLNYSNMARVIACFCCCRFCVWFCFSLLLSFSFLFLIFLLSFLFSLAVFDSFARSLARNYLLIHLNWCHHADVFATSIWTWQLSKRFIVFPSYLNVVKCQNILACLFWYSAQPLRDAFIFEWFLSLFERYRLSQSPTNHSCNSALNRANIYFY